MTPQPPPPVRALAGQLWLRPGAPLPHNLRSSRPDWVAQVATGRSADALPGVLAALFNLCGRAHHGASRLAIAQAAPAWAPGLGDVGALLQRDTALEHLRRIGLDWPRLLARPDHLGAAGDGAGDGASDGAGIASLATTQLARCPLLTQPHDPAPWPAMCAWLQDGWLQMKPATWLRAWQAGGAGWLDDWSRRHTGWLPQLLRQARGLDTPLPTAQGLALRPHADPARLRQLGVALAAHGGPGLPPAWAPAGSATGPWCRLHDLPPAQPWTAWALLGSRLAELVRLCLPDAPGHAGAGWLAWGALATGDQRGLGWVEMARGLLVHQVQLQGPGASGAAPARRRGAGAEAEAEGTDGTAPQVAACQVLAPTDWNFHPTGLAAQALASLPGQAPDLAARVRLLMAALDPCVPFTLASAIGQDAHQEDSHA